ncbi:hypothetical protein ACFL6U_08900 [Planctomycetota bacterium]
MSIDIAYARKYGAIGWGVTKSPSSYRLLQPGSKEDVLDGLHLHRLDMAWKWATRDLKNAICPQEFLAKYGIFHPRSKRVKIASDKARQFIADMANNPSFSQI